MREPSPSKPNQSQRSWMGRVGKNAILQLFAGLICGLALAQEIEGRKSEPKDPKSRTSENPSAPEQGNEKKLAGAYDAARQSLGWMTQSLQQMADKLDNISSKLDRNASEEEINREVKRAMREAFADFLPGKSDSSTQPVAELDSNSRGAFDEPIWDSTTPAWVKDRIVDREVIRIAIESSVESSAQECRTSMDQQQTDMVRKVLDDHVLKHAKASEIEQLTPEYLSGKLVKPNTEFELVLDRPSGTYHQLFRLVHIGPDQIEEIQRWEREFVTTKRVQWVSGSALSALMLLASASGITGLLAKRSNSRRG